MNNEDFPKKDQLDRILSDQNYMTLATVSNDGIPHCTPVFFAQGHHLKFYWLSSPDAQHSKNIENKGHVSAVIFDSSAPQGTGIGIYLKGSAWPLNDDRKPYYATKGTETDFALRLLTEKGQNLPSIEKLKDPNCPRKLYVFFAEEAKYNGAIEEKGIWVDHTRPMDIVIDGARRDLYYPH